MGETGTEIATRDAGAEAKKEAFVVARLRGRSIEEAMADAGFPESDWLRIIEDPAIAARLERGVKGMAAQLSADAIRYGAETMRIGTSADRVRLDAARAILGIAGHVAPVRERATQRNVNLAELAPEDLRALVAQLQGEIAARGAPIAPAIADKRPNPLD